MKQIYYDSYLKIIDPHREVIENIIDVMDQYNFEKEKTKLLDAGFSKRFLDLKKSIIKNDRKKYFSNDRANTVCKTILDFNLNVTCNKKTKMLDLGCGYGEYASIFKSYGYDVIGTNAPFYNDDFIFVNKLLGIPYVLCDIRQKLPFADKQFDIVFCIGVLTLQGMKGKIPFAANELKRVCKKQICLKIHEKMIDYHQLDMNNLFLGEEIIGNKDHWVVNLY